MKKLFLIFILGFVFIACQKTVVNKNQEKTISGIDTKNTRNIESTYVQVFKLAPPEENQEKEISSVEVPKINENN
ncbi:hypothetical protein [Cetobacterium sp. SF1]|uniref:hypothetical protein n=1 Tax=Cetobacterium sp. SF1 TaxID=3417654 RepID=UPI003CEB543E